MMKLHPRSFARTLPPAVLAVSLLAAYLRTLAPGLSWAHAGSDGGDLIAAAATGGVPHPTGYPLYLLAAGLFQLLPAGSLAFRTNLMSAVFAVLAALLVYATVTQSRLPSGLSAGWPGAMLSGYAFGLAPLVWSQAVITEVYTLQALLMAILLYLYAKPAPAGERARKRLDRWRGLVLGAALSNHVTALLLVPAALCVGSVERRMQPEGHDGFLRSRFDGWTLNRSALLRQLALLAAGLSLYLLIPIRALTHPPVSWGNAVTPARFWWLVSGELYQSYYLQFSLPEAPGRLQSLAALFLQQFGFPIILLGLIGLAASGIGSRLHILTSWSILVFGAFTLLYGSADSFVYVIPMVLSFAVWAGLGTGRLTQRFTKQAPVAGVLLGGVVIAYFAGRVLALSGQMDASRDMRAESFAREVLSTAPRDAILFASGDEAVFALWYAHYALGERRDLGVLATDLLQFEWYQENLRRTYPSLVIPAPFPWPEAIASVNPFRTICYVRYGNGTAMDCVQAKPAP